MDFNLIRLSIEHELECSDREIELVLNDIERDSKLQRKAVLFVNGIYQSISPSIKRNRKMVISWNVHGQMHLVIEQLMVT